MKITLNEQPQRRSFSRRHKEAIVEFGKLLKRQNGRIQTGCGITISGIPKMRDPADWAWLSVTLAFGDSLSAARFAQSLHPKFTVVEYAEEAEDLYPGKPLGSPSPSMGAASMPAIMLVTVFFENMLVMLRKIA